MAAVLHKLSRRTEDFADDRASAELHAREAERLLNQLHATLPVYYSGKQTET